MVGALGSVAGHNMEMTWSTFKVHCDEYDGYCSKCDQITQFGDVEPDAEGRLCDECEENTVMGVEQAMLKGLIDVQED